MPVRHRCAYPYYPKRYTYTPLLPYIIFSLHEFTQFYKKLKYFLLNITSLSKQLFIAFKYKMPAITRSQTRSQTRPQTRSQSVLAVQNDVTVKKPAKKPVKKPVKKPISEQVLTEKEEAPVFQKPDFDSLSTIEDSANALKYCREFPKQYPEKNEYINILFNIIMSQLKLISNPSFDEIDSLLKIAENLFGFRVQNYDLYSQFIFACPHKFMLAYSNNSERIPWILLVLHANKLYRLHDYIHYHINDFKLNTLRERLSGGFGIFGDIIGVKYIIPSKKENRYYKNIGLHLSSDTTQTVINALPIDLSKKVIQYV